MFAATFNFFLLLLMLPFFLLSTQQLMTSILDHVSSKSMHPPILGLAHPGTLSSL
jgi:hypothetical protein